MSIKVTGAKTTLTGLSLILVGLANAFLTKDVSSLPETLIAGIGLVLASDSQ